MAVASLLWISTISWACSGAASAMAWSARPDSPTPVSLCCRVLVPTALPIEQGDERRTPAIPRSRSCGAAHSTCPPSTPALGGSCRSDHVSDATPCRTSSPIGRSTLPDSLETISERTNVCDNVRTDGERDSRREQRGDLRSRKGPSAPGSRACARRWISRFGTWPSAAASALRCSPRSRGGTRAPRWRSREKIASGLDLTLSQLLRLDEDRHVVVVRAGRGPHAAPARPQGRGADPAAARPARRRLGSHPGARRRHRRAPTTRPCTSPAVARPRWWWRAPRSSSSTASGTSSVRATASPSTRTCPHHFENNGETDARLIAVVAAGLRRG